MSSEKKHIYVHSKKVRLEVFEPKPFIDKQEVTLATGEKKEINNWVLCGLDRAEYQWWKKDSYSLADTLKIAGADEEKFSASVERPLWANDIDLPTIDLPTCRDCPYSHFETYSKVSCGCNVYPGKYDGSKFVCHRFVNSFEELKSTYEEFESMREEKNEKERLIRETIQKKEEERLEKERIEATEKESRVLSLIERIRSCSKMGDLKWIWADTDFTVFSKEQKGKIIEEKDKKKSELSAVSVKKERVEPSKKTRRGVAPPRRRR